MFNLSDFEEWETLVEGVKKGAYNLFLGAGATHECLNKNRNKFLLGGELSDKLCALKDVAKGKKINQVAKLFKDETDSFANLLTRYFDCGELSPAIKSLPRYVWKGIYTLNVDNAIEKAYNQNKNSQQNLITLNFDDIYCANDTLMNVQLLHMHGFIDKKESGFIFDANEYVQMIKQNNTWLSVFCDIFRSNSFIISGLSFDEMDLEYYSSFRKQIAARPDSYPSILIEPFPDSITEQNCKDLNLLLIKATFEEFMDSLIKTLPNPPTVYDLQNAFDFEFDENKVAKNEIMAFYSRFEYIKKKNISTSQLTGFDFGHEPEVNDINLKKDVSRKINTEVLSAVSSADLGTLILVHGRMLTGKTTIALRSILDLNETEFVCFRLKCISGFEPKNIKRCLETVERKCLLFIDNIAEYMPLVIQLLDNAKNIIVLGAERDYRKIHVEQVSGKNYIPINANEVEDAVTERLYEKYLNAGEVKYSHNRITECYGKAVGEQVCTLINNFIPIRNKISESIKEYNDNGKSIEILLKVAIANYCYTEGINYDLLSFFFPIRYDIKKLFNKDYPLALSFNKNNNDYVVFQNRLYLTKLIEIYKEENLNLLQDCYKNIIRKLTPDYVNRKTVCRRTPEAKLLARMLDVSSNVIYFFPGKQADKFMEDIKESCKWNSRYWEQRALLILDKDINCAINYAETAVSIEEHPYTFTTMSKILFKKMSLEKDDKSICTTCIAALEYALKAMKEEGIRHMESVTPVFVIIDGLEKYYAISNKIDLDRKISDTIFAALETYKDMLRFSNSEINKIEMVQNYLR